MSTSVSGTSSLTQLQQLFPKVILVDARALATALGIREKTIHNQGDAFCIPSVRFGRNKFFRLIDVAAYIDNSLGIAPISTSTPAPEPVVASGAKPAVPSTSLISKRKRGRPSNAELAKGRGV